MTASSANKGINDYYLIVVASYWPSTIITGYALREDKVKKATWKVHTMAKCKDCGKEFSNYKNCQALAAQHAKKYKHIVKGEIGLAFEYDGKST